MKNLYRNILVLLGVLLGGQQLLASHIIGGEITYTCLGNDQYEIELQVYRDCFNALPGADFDDPASIAVYNPSGTLIQSIQVPLTVQSDTLDGDVGDPCLFVPPDVCVQRATYRRTITLFPQPGGYVLSYQRCCRNQTINNIANPSETGATYSVRMTEQAMQLCNSTPTFDNFAPIFVCVDKEITFNHSATDPDGDQLVYSLCTPNAGASLQQPQPTPPAPPPYDSVQYIPPFNINNLLGFGDPLSIDPQTGELSGLPTVQGQYVVGVCVSEYRNGMLLSTVRRDFQYNVGVCGEIVSAIAAPAAQCDDLTVEFGNATDMTFAENFRWYFEWPDTTIRSTLTEPSYTYPDTGTYTVALIAEPGASCADTTFHEVFLQFNSLTGDFDFTVYDCTDESILELRDNSVDLVSPPVAWEWTVAVNGQFYYSTEQNPFISVPTPSSGVITLRVRTQNGCEQTVIQTFTAGGNNPIDQIAAAVEVCAGDGVALNPNFDPSIPYGYLWSPATGLDDPTAPNPIASPPNDLTYSVTVSGPNNLCSSTTEVSVDVLPTPQLDFDYTFDCDNFTVDFINQSTDSDGFRWNFGDPTNPNAGSTETNPTYTYPSSGTFTVTLQPGTGALCQDVLTRDITIPVSTLTAGFELRTFDCDDESIVQVLDESTDDAATPVAWSYTLVYGGQTLTSTAQNPFFTVPLNVTGTVTQTVTAQNGCQKTRTQSFQTGGKNPADLIPDALEVCRGEGVALNPSANLIPGWNYVWSPATGLDNPTADNPTAAPQNTTTYSVTATPPNNACSVETEVVVTVVPLPQLAFDYTFDCNDFTVEFSNQSTDSDGFRWLFGDPTNPGASSAAEHPTYVYPGAGTYTVSLLTGAGALCQDTLVETIVIPEQTLDVDFNLGVYDCETVSILELTDGTTDAASDVVGWAWSVVFGNQFLTSTEQNPLFTVPNPTAGTITLTVTAANGCDLTLQRAFQTGGNNPTDAIAGEVQVCSGDGVALNPNYDSSLNWQYQWSPTFFLDDPNAPNPTASPTGDLTYTATITAPGGLCEVSAAVNVDVLPLPELAFATELACNDPTITFVNQSTNADGFRWFFGDPNNPGATSTEAHPTYTYAAPGTYLVTLTTGDDALCKDTLTTQVEVQNRILAAAFDLSYAACDAEAITIEFENQSVNNLGNTSGYVWTIATNDGTFTSTDVNPTLTLAEEQTIQVTLEISTDDGCTSATAATDLFIDFTELNLSPVDLQICRNEIRGLNPGGDPTYQYAWSPAAGLDDPNSPNPNADPDASVVYTVTVTNSNGAAVCTLVDSVSVVVPPLPELTVSDDVLTCNDTVTLFAATTLEADLAFLQDGLAVGTGGSLLVEVSGTQTFVVSATDDFGCVDNSAPITVAGGPVDVSSTGDEIICNSENPTVELTNLDPNDNLTYSWAPSSYILAGADTPNPTLANVPGQTTLFVTVENQFGCTDTEAIDLVIVNEDADLSFTSELQCNGATVDFTNTSTNAFGYQWTFGDPANPNATSTEVNPTYTYDTPGTYPVTLDIVYDVDCVESFTSAVTIIEPNIISDFDFEYVACSTEEIVITFSDESVNNFNNTTGILWTFGDDDTYTSPQVEITITQDTVLEVSLQIFTANDCEAIRTESVFIDLIDEINLATEDIVHCAGDTTALNPNNTGNYNYQWFPATGLDDPTSDNPLAFPEETTTYTVFISNISADTCEVVREVTVFVPTEIELTAPQDTFTCGNVITLEAATNIPVEFAWFNENGNQLIGAETIEVGPILEETYTLRVEDDFGCFKEAEVTVTNRQVDAFLQDSVFSCPTNEIFLDVVTNPDPADTLSYQWTADPGGIIFQDDDTETPTINAEIGFTNFFIEMTNQYGCVRTDLTTVQIYDFQPQTPPDQNVCTGIETTLNAGAADDKNYVWSPATFLNDPTLPSPTVTTEAPQTYGLFVSQQFPTELCQDSFTVEVTINPLIELGIRNDTLLCDDNGLALTTTSEVPVTYTWATNPAYQDPFSTTPAPQVFPDGDVTYYVLVEDQFGCLDSAQVTVSAYPVNIALETEADLCLGDELVLAATNLEDDQDVMYTWTPTETIINGANTNSPLVNPEVSTTYTVVAENQFGCRQTDSIFVDVFDIQAGLTVSAEPDTLYFGSGQTSQLDVTFDPDYRYEWSNATSLDDPFTNNPVASPEVTTSYSVTVSNDLGCVAVEEVLVTVLDPRCDEPFIFVPSGFSPNGDGSNDVLFVRSNIIDQMTLIIYNRWGQKVFESDNLGLGWDGTFNGRQLEPDVFGYHLSARCFNGDTFGSKGSITLLR